jgi:hypothetical protein
MGFQRSVTVTPPIKKIKNDEAGNFKKKFKNQKNTKIPTLTPSLTQNNFFLKKNNLQTPSKLNFKKIITINVSKINSLKNSV